MDAHLGRGDDGNALASVLVRVLGCQPPSEAAHRDLRLCDRDAVVETSLHEEHTGIRGTPLQGRRRYARKDRHRGNRQPEIGDEADVDRRVVAHRPNADDRDRCSLHADGATDDRRIPTEAGRPRPVAEDRNDVRARPIVSGVEPAASCWLQPENGRVRRRRVLDDGAADGTPIEIGCGVGHARGHDLRKHAGVLRHVEIRRVRVDALSTLATVLIDLDEAVRICEQRLAKERGVDGAEDCGVGADPEPEDEDSRGGEAPVAEQAPRCVPSIAPQVINERSAPRVAVFLL